MVKLILKGIIFILGVQSLLGKLQNQGIIKGSIEINYQVLQEKIISIITSNEFNGLVKKINAPTENVNHYSEPEQVQPENNNFEYDNFTENRNHFVDHIIQQGETLSDLGELYGISWKVIKKINHIYNERRLMIGQHIIIPNLSQCIG